MNEFSILVQKLKQSMTDDYFAVHPQKNPVKTALVQMNDIQIALGLRQYSVLPSLLVRFLQSARDQAVVSNWQFLVHELDENLAEEMGSKTQGVPHADLLINGLEACLKIPVKAAVPSAATVKLMNQLNQLSQLPLVFALGGAYAIEATASPELEIVVSLLKHLKNAEVSPGLKHFFEMHLNEWEPEHEAGLVKAIAFHIKPDQFFAFTAGFHAMMSILDSWWADLASELVQIIPEAVRC